MTKTAKERNLRFAGRSIESKKEERKRADTLIAMHSNRIFGEERKEEKKKKKLVTRSIKIGESNINEWKYPVSNLHGITEGRKKDREYEWRGHR